MENHPPANEWIGRADSLTTQLLATGDIDERRGIIAANEGIWRELKNHLSNIKNRKCWYSESINDGAHCHVDHFRPKTNALNENGVDEGGYWWLAFDWLNYRYSGPASNVRKKDYFPVVQNKANGFADNLNLEDILLLDPINIDDPTKLIFDEEGKVGPRFTDKTSREYKRAYYSIERYNLNSEGLKEGRRQKFFKTTQLIINAQKLIALQVVNYDLARQSEIIKIWKELRELTHPNSEYSATAKYCLRSSGYDWATDVIAA
ncbi:hypothetical protein [Mucilaginibacter sp.]|uniref:hypothetical protein n=1 Tax=Mucilaginibacter sp. TaxID=1882438 RepID=UPI003267BA64